MAVTATKRKRIARELAAHGAVLTWATVQAFANRHHLSVSEIRQVAASRGYLVADPPAPPPVAKKSDAPQPMVPREVLTAILKGSIYSTVGDPEGEGTVFVVTTLDRWQKEREAIRKLLSS